MCHMILKYVNDCLVTKLFVLTIYQLLNIKCIVMYDDLIQDVIAYIMGKHVQIYTQQKG